SAHAPAPPLAKSAQTQAGGSRPNTTQLQAAAPPVAQCSTSTVLPTQLAQSGLDCKNSGNMGAPYFP
ncbi:hypothetical protein P7K49_030994, partial [Saguinus oedipus]